MKQTINVHQFCQAFTDCGRANQFTRAALEVLFDFLEEVDPDSELDPIGICCAWTEYNNAQDAAFDYGADFDREQCDNALEWLRDRTTVLNAGETYVVANF